MKGAVEVLTKYMARNSNRSGPALMSWRRARSRPISAAEWCATIPNMRASDMTALDRAGLPDNVGPMIASLLSADDRWVDAQRIDVSGGCRSGRATQRRYSASIQAVTAAFTSSLRSSMIQCPAPVHASTFDFGCENHGRMRLAWAGSRHR